MDIRAIVLRVLAVGLVHFGKKLLDETVREMDRLTALREQEQTRQRARAGPKLRIIVGDKK